MFKDTNEIYSLLAAVFDLGLKKADLFREIENTSSEYVQKLLLTKIDEIDGAFSFAVKTCQQAFRDGTVLTDETPAHGLAATLKNIREGR